MIITILDYLKQTTSNPFLGSATKPEGIVGEEFQNALTGYISNNYYNYHFLSRIFVENFSNDASAVETAVRETCDRVYLSHAYTYDKLYKTLNLEYNPILNYDMQEHEETENRGSDVTSKSVGSHTDSETDDGRQITDSYAKDTTTDDSNADKAPFNSQTYQKLDKGHNTQVRDARTDTHKDSGTTITRSYGGHQDQDTLQHGHDITRDLTRSGNIGTMTTQDMIKQEREVAMFNLVAIVANDLISALCIKYKGVSY